MGMKKALLEQKPLAAGGKNQANAVNLRRVATSNLSPWGLFPHVPCGIGACTR